ncbi:MAG: hypothetical protein WCK09_14275 [Bacteroidota bacterium]
MKTKSENKNQPDWQQLVFSGLEFDFNLENDGSEDDEYNFYCYTGDFKSGQKKKRRERNAEA